MSTVQQQPSSEPGTPAATPQGGTEQPKKTGPDKCTVIFKYKDWTVSTYEYTSDGSTGFLLTNGQSALHFDANGNMILASGKPLGGCGGKAIVIAEESQQKYKSMAVEITGNDEKIEKQENSSGNTETVKVPAYSLVVYGDIAIEAVGGDIGLKGNNITLNASSTLTLKSGENVLLQSGGDASTGAAGNLNIAAGNVNLDAINFKKKISGGEYSEGAGEFKVEQNKKGAVTEITTPGAFNQIIQGNYTLGVKGDYAINTDGSFALSSKKHYFVTAVGNADEKIDGKKKLTVDGLEYIPTNADGSTGEPIKQQEPFLIEVGAATKGTTSMKVDSNSDIQIGSKIGALKANAKTNVEIEATAEVKIVATKIYLN